MVLLPPIINNIQTAFDIAEGEIPVYFYLQQDRIEGMYITAEIRIPSVDLNKSKEIDSDIQPSQTLVLTDTLSNKTQYAFYIPLNDLEELKGANDDNINYGYQISLILKYKDKNNEETVSSSSTSCLFYPTSLTDIEITPNEAELQAIENLTFHIKGKKANPEDTDYIKYCVLKLNGESSDRVFSNYKGEVEYTYIHEFYEQYKKDYTLEVIFITNKGYVGSKTFNYTTQKDPIAAGDGELTIEVKNDEEQGYNKITITKAGNTNTGIYKVYRKAISDPIWYLLYESEKEIDKSSIDFTDKTVEFGVAYQYKATFTYNNYKIEVDTEEQPIYSFFDDMFLINKQATLRIKYNPDVSGLKYNIVDTVTPTLGSKYPFIRRNGTQKYRTFTIGGLISYHMNEYEIMDQEIVDSITNNAVIAQLQDINNIENKTRREWMLERHYRDAVIEFLTADNIKLFKSEPEGNILVKLSNVSLTPNKQLGRNIYSFSATATEIDAATIDNFEKYGIMDIKTVATNTFYYNDYVLYLEDGNIATVESADEGAAALILEQVQTEI